MAKQQVISVDEGFYRRLFEDCFGTSLVVERSSLRLICCSHRVNELLELDTPLDSDAALGDYLQLPLFAALRLQLKQHSEADDLCFELPVNKRMLSISVRTFYEQEQPLLRVFLNDISSMVDHHKQLKALNERLSIATEAAGSGIWDLDLVSGALEWDAQQHRLFGTDPDSFTGDYDAWKRCVHPDDVESAVAQVEQAIADKKLFHTEFRVVHPNGTIRHIEAHALPQYNEAGKPVRMVGVNWDITERKRAEQVVVEAAMIFDASPEAIMATHPDGTIKMVNSAFSRTTGYSAPEALGRKTSILKSGRHGDLFYRQMWQQLLDQGRWEGEIWNRRKSGEIYPEWQAITALKNDRGEVVEYISIFSDITERKKQEQEVWRKANFDGLTDLANRNLLVERGSEVLKQASEFEQMVGLLFIDLDRFKLINDTLGHEAGDQLLIDVAKRLQNCVGGKGLLARVGGDEFAVLVSTLEQQELFDLCEAIDAAIEMPFVLNGVFQTVGCSVGAAVYPQDASDFSTLLKRSDIAMSKAKQSGTNNYQFFSSSMHAELVGRIDTERDLRRALKQDEFELYYQPINAVNSGRIIGAEGLIRWNDPDKGLVPPFKFIPVAEESGLIVEIGAWVLEQGIRQLYLWQQQGLDLRLSLNVSSIQFQQPAFISHLFGLLRQYPVDPSHLVLEITESILIDNIQSVEERLELVRAKGVRLALDDFGTGFSSLNYLKSLKTHYVKIDRSFVMDCTDQGENAHLVQAVVNLANGLDLDVVAEGVETQEQLSFLQTTGCEFFQGYLVSPPVPLAQYEALLD